MKSGNLKFLELSGPLQACNRTALPLRTCIRSKPLPSQLYSNHATVVESSIEFDSVSKHARKQRNLRVPLICLLLCQHYWNWAGFSPYRTTKTLIIKRTCQSSNNTKIYTTDDGNNKPTSNSNNCPVWIQKHLQHTKCLNSPIIHPTTSKHPIHSAYNPSPIKAR